MRFVIYHVFIPFYLITLSRSKRGPTFECAQFAPCKTLKIEECRRRGRGRRRRVYYHREVDQSRMLKALFNRWRTSRPFKDFYTEWITTLKSTLLPLLSRSLSSPSPDLLILSTHVDLLHSHFHSYFTALDVASNTDATHLFFPDWRNPLEKPFLWLGDFHPYIFTNLLRSFLEDDDTDANDDGQAVEFRGKVCNAWRNVDCSLWHNVDQMECGLRLMVPSIVARHKDAQAAVVHKLAVGWRRERGELKVGEVLGDVVDELNRVFLDANRLRRSVLGDIIGALNVLQAALFLERLAQFYVGFWDAKLLAEFKKSRLPLD